MLKVIKMIGLVIVGFIALLVIVGVVFLYTSPQFGGSATKEQIAEYEKTGHYKEGKFQNLTETKMMEFTLSNMVDMTKAMMKGNPNLNPGFELPVVSVCELNVDTNKENRLIWFGHSAFLLQLDGENILLDPMLGQHPAPHPTVARDRYNKHLPIEIEELPQIDAIVISHDLL